jgi:hypothetical protein
MTDVKTSTQDRLATHLRGHVAMDREDYVADRVMSSGLVVSTAEHTKRVNDEIDAVSRQMQRADTAERRVRELQYLVDVTSVERVDAVIKTLREVPTQRTAKHGPDCWQRHAGCLAGRVHDLLMGREVR